MQTHTTSIAKTIFAAALFASAANAYAGPTYRPDMNIDISGPAAADVSSTLHYDLLVKNDGYATARNTLVTVTLPTNTSFLQASSQCTANGNLLTCNLGKFGLRSRKNLAFELTAPATAATLNLTAAVTTATQETNSSNNTDTIQTVVTNQPDIIINPPTGGSVNLRVQDCWEPMSLDACPPEMIMNDLTLPLNDNHTIDTGSTTATGVWSQPDNKTIVMDFYNGSTHLSHFTGSSISTTCFEGTFEYYTAVHSSTWRGCIVP